MNIALYHDQYGYYNKQNSIFGAKGDFITAPIASSFFGESISNELLFNDEGSGPIIYIDSFTGDDTFRGSDSFNYSGTLRPIDSFNGNGTIHGQDSFAQIGTLC